MLHELIVIGARQPFAVLASDEIPFPSEGPSETANTEYFADNHALCAPTSNNKAPRPRYRRTDKSISKSNPATLPPNEYIAGLINGLIRIPQPLPAKEFFKRYPLKLDGADAAFDLELNEVIVCMESDKTETGKKLPAPLKAPSVTNVTLTTSRGGKLNKRAVLHPTQKVDVISLELVQDLGLTVEKYDGKPVRVLTKADMKPLGRVEVEWRFVGSLQKIRKTTFLVVHIRGFSLLLGASYIQQHGLRVYTD
ncbi:hypothetical protein FQN53_006184 [Emmonsiellopsis sp. PD_33]|nr:hypothetical protein FQN53_006184 [Emmonsiellopsis sp. PD_33]